MSETQPVVQLAHSSFVWAAEVPRLDRSEGPPPAGERRPVALALVRAFATDGPEGSALQLRYEARGSDGRAVPLLLGRARTAEEATALARLAALTVPSTHGLRPLTEAAIRGRMIPFELDALTARHVAEIRRVADVSEDGQAALLPWPATQTDADLGALLDRAPAGSLLCLHLERATAADELVAQLHSTVRELRDDLDTETDPARRRALAAHRVWIRELPKGAVQLRVTLVAAEPLAPGLADLVGLALAGAIPGESGVGYEIVRPRNRQELDLALQLIDDVRAGNWGRTDDVELEELRPMFSAVEAAAAFHLPSIIDDAGDPSIGAVVSFPAVRDRLLRAVTSVASEGFLVVDLSRGDYARLAEELAKEAGAPVRRIRLDPTARGFDPFVVPAGSSRHGHAGRALSAFDLAYGFSEQSPASWMLLSRAVYDAYDATIPGTPSIEDLTAAVDGLLRRLSLDSGGGHELRAGLLGRLELLASGPLGAVLQAGAPLDWRELLSRPTIVELGGLSGPQERMLVAGMLLAGFLSWRESTPLTPGSRHLLVLGGAARMGHALQPAARWSDGVAALADGVAGLAGSGQAVVVVAPAVVSGTGVLPAPDDWILPTVVGGAAIALAPSASASHSDHATSGVGS